MKFPRRKNTVFLLDEDPRNLPDEEAPKLEEKRGGIFFKYLYISITVFFLILTSRLTYLSIVEGKRNAYLSEGNHVRELVIRAPRGLIYDKNGILLARNAPNYELLTTPGDLPDSESERDKLYSKISSITGLSSEEIKKKAEEKGLEFYKDLLIQPALSRDAALNLEAAKQDLPGFKVEINPIREYPEGAAFAHLLGYAGRIDESEYKANPEYLITDFIGKDGIELSYESKLRGVHGANIAEVDAFGKVVRTIGPPREPIPGQPVYLTIDANLQKIAESALRTGLKKAKRAKGSVVALDPKTGEVRALVSLPSYDNNLFAKGITQQQYQGLIGDPNLPLFFRAINGEFPSGSIIKPFIASAGLQEKIITPSSTVNSTGGLKVKDNIYPDYNTSGHGSTNLSKAIRDSVNTYFYILGGGLWDTEGTKVLKQGLGIRRIEKYLKSFGFGEKTGIDLPTEAAGQIPNPEWKLANKGYDCTRGANADECWYLGDTYNLSIGQGDFETTPLQMAAALSAIANGGTMYKPRLYMGTGLENGNIQKTSPEVVRQNVISENNLRAVRDAMRQTVTNGSGRALSSLNIAVAGKTGTAQFGTNNQYKHSWFSSFAPYNDPQIVLVVLLEGAGEGHEFAAPVAKEIYQNYFR